MLTNFGKGIILKGSDCEIAVGFSTCRMAVDIEQVENFSCSIYTTVGGAALQKTLEDFEIDGEVGIVHLEWEELDQLDDGAVRYTLNYDFEGDHIVIERSTGYYLKTPVGYTPIDFVSRDEMDSVIISALTSSANTETINNIVNEAVSGLASETYVDNAVSGLASEDFVREITSGMATESYVDSAVSEIHDWVFVLSGYTQYWDVNISAINELIEFANSLTGTPQFSDCQYAKIRVFIHHDTWMEFHPIALTQSSITIYSVIKGRDYWDNPNLTVWYGTLYKDTQIPEGGLSQIVFDPRNIATTADTAALRELIGTTSSALTDAINEAVSGLASETYVDNAVSGLATEVFVNEAISAATSAFTTSAETAIQISTAVSGLASEEYVINALSGVDDYVRFITGGTANNAVIDEYLSTQAELRYKFRYIFAGKVFGPRGWYSGDTLFCQTIYEEFPKVLVDGTEGQCPVSFLHLKLRYDTAPELTSWTGSFGASGTTGSGITEQECRTIVTEMTSGYTTSAETTQMINEAVSGLASEDYVDNAVSNLPSTADTASQIASALTNYVQTLTTTNKIWTGTAAQYAALGTYDNNTLYFIDQE